MTRVFGSAAASLYGAAVAARNCLYDRKVIGSYRSTLPVVSIGNLTAGGNAKTPLALFLAGELSARGYAPVLLSRGYGGRIRGPYLLEGTESPGDVGDEPLMMATAGDLEVVISRDRSAGTRFIEAEKLGNLIILDDGLQHRKLHRTLEIVSVNISTDRAIEAFVAGELLPLGMFRENRDAALKRAHMIVFAARQPEEHSRVLDERLLALVPEHVQIYRSFMAFSGVRSLSSGTYVSLAGDVAILCAIANPEGFIGTVRGIGLSVVHTECLGDHAPLPLELLRRMSARYPDIPIVCTAKDAVKLQVLPEEIKDRIYVLEAELQVVPQDAFVVQCMRILREHR